MKKKKLVDISERKISETSVSTSANLKLNNSSVPIQ